MIYVYPGTRESWCSINHIYATNFGSKGKGRYKTKEGQAYIGNWLAAFETHPPPCEPTSEALWLHFDFYMLLSHEDYYAQNGNVKKPDVTNYGKPVEDAYVTYCNERGILIDDKYTERWCGWKCQFDISRLVLCVEMVKSPFGSIPEDVLQAVLGANRTELMTKPPARQSRSIRSKA